MPRKKPTKQAVDRPPFPQGESTVGTVHGDGRANTGRFGPGNTFAAGNTNNQRAQALRAALLAKATPDRVGGVIEKLLEDAVDEDPQVRLPSRKELLDRVIGKAQQFVHVTEEPESRPDLSQMSEAELEQAHSQALENILEALVKVAPDRAEATLKRLRAPRERAPGQKAERARRQGGV